jgi:hypothetical protein
MISAKQSGQLTLNLNLMLRIILRFIAAIGGIKTDLLTFTAQIF